MKEAKGSLGPPAVGCVIFLALCVILTGPVQAEDPEILLYAEYEDVLSSYVSTSGRVNYSALQGNRSDLDTYVEKLRFASIQDWSRPAQMAFWINAYNGLTLRVIVDNYPIQARFLASLAFPRNSIRQIEGVWDEIQFPVAGRELTLDQIEHSILRRQFEEPRIHVALVCAAVGCPALRREPFRGERLEEQLRDQAARFVRDPSKVRVDRPAGVVHLSSIFKWFGQDFERDAAARSVLFSGHPDSVQAVLNFVLPFLSEEDQAYLQGRVFRIEYLSYDWTLNE